MTGKVSRRRMTAALIAYLVLICLSCFFLWHRKLDTLQPIYVLNIAADLFGMFTIYVLYNCCLIDVQKKGSSELFFFLTLLNIAFVGLFTDACAWMVDGIPSLRVLNYIDNVFYYMCGTLGAFVFWSYVVSWTRTDKKIILAGKHIFRVVTVISLILILITPFTGLYFTVDAAGVYARSTYSSLSTIFPAVMMMSSLLTAILERNKLELYQLTAVFLYTLTPVAMMLLSNLVYGISLTYAMVTLVLLLMYCMFNVTQGRAQAVAERDLAVATAIQQNVLPRIFPPFPEHSEFDLYASMTPAREVGGDFYDFFLIDDDHLALVIADVSGKGVPAALFMMVSKVLIKNRLLAGDSPELAISAVNDQLASGNTNSMFVTVWAAVLTLSSGELVVVNAGHEHPAVRTAQGSYELSVYEHSPCVGMIEELPFEERTISLRPGDSLFVYTDGIPEAQDTNGKMFETDRMLDALNRNPDAGPKETIEEVMNAILSFRGNADQFDDITMLCLKYHGPVQEGKETDG